MNNKDIEHLGIRAVEHYETAAGRSEIKRVHSCGYDLECRNPNSGEVRHIEVKSTKKAYFTSRWLEQKEQDALNEDPLFFLYLVTDALTKPKVWDYTRDTIPEQKKITKYLYSFRKSEFLQKP
jgi:hypothetical protein